MLALRSSSPINTHNGNVRSWKSFAKGSMAFWRKGAADFITCGECLSAAKDELPRDAFNVMVKTKLDFDASVARKLMLHRGERDPLCTRAQTQASPSWAHPL